jgi:protoheme IX farnesyltransferase
VPTSLATATSATRPDRAPHPDPALHPARLVPLLADLTKARLSTLVVVTTAVGFLVASGAAIDWARFAWTVLGTALAAGGANAINQWWEAHLDARMERTRGRPVPSGAIARPHALALAATIAAAGPIVLLTLVNTLTAALATLTILLYVFVYTPLKTRSPACTLVGAVCGAIPPMMGVTGAAGVVDHRAWILFLLLFVWQIPHFLALAWLYREDYERGGFKMLPLVDPEGRYTSRSVVLYSLALLPVGFAVTWAGLAGWGFAIGALVLGLWMVRLAMRLAHDHTQPNARRLFLASITYLPILMALMVVDRGPGSGLSFFPGEGLAVISEPFAMPTGALPGSPDGASAASPPGASAASPHGTSAASPPGEHAPVPDPGASAPSGATSGSDAPAAPVDPPTAPVPTTSTSSER